MCIIPVSRASPKRENARIIKRENNPPSHPWAGYWISRATKRGKEIQFPVSRD